MDSYNLENLSSIFSLNNVFPETTMKLLSILDKEQNTYYEEVEVVEQQKIVLKDGYYPLLVIFTDKNKSRIFSKEYRSILTGKQHRDNDLPSEIQYYKNGGIKLETYRKDGEIHRDGDKPGSVSYYKKERIESHIYYKYGEIHRDGDKPALIEYGRDGKIKLESYYRDGEIHRDGDKPAYIEYDRDGKIKLEIYYRDGKNYETREIPLCFRN